MKHPNTPFIISFSHITAIIILMPQSCMQSNPTKFQSIFFGKTPKCSIVTNDVTVESTGLITLLGVSIDAQLNFNNHVSNICTKAGRNLNALKRVAKHLPTSVKLLLYKTYITCHFNFCPLVWHFCGVSNTKKLEKLQYRALKFVFDDYESDYEALLFRANLPNLELSRQRAMCTAVFKCIHNLAPSYMSELFNQQDKSLHNTRNVKALIQSHYDSVTYGANTFVNYSTHLWNNLPNNIKVTSDLDVFKAQIDTWLGPKCNCNFCRSINNIY